MPTLAETLRRTALPSRTTDFNDIDDPEVFHPFAKLALQQAPNRPTSQIQRWHIYADGTHQADSTKDAWALVLLAEDSQGFTFQGAITAKTKEATKITGTEKPTSTTSELAALIWAYA